MSWLSTRASDRHCRDVKSSHFSQHTLLSPFSQVIWELQLGEQNSVRSGLLVCWGGSHHLHSMSTPQYQQSFWFFPCRKMLFCLSSLKPTPLAYLPWPRKAPLQHFYYWILTFFTLFPNFFIGLPLYSGFTGRCTRGPFSQDCCVSICSLGKLPLHCYFSLQLILQA